MLLTLALIPFAAYGFIIVAYLAMLALAGVGIAFYGGVYGIYKLGFLGKYAVIALLIYGAFALFSH